MLQYFESKLAQKVITNFGEFIKVLENSRLIKNFLKESSPDY